MLERRAMPQGPVALVYPPTCDPTAPYLAVPMLTGFLRANAVEVLPIDANLEAFDALLSQGRLSLERDRLETKLARLDRRGSLAHGEQMEYAALVAARADAHALPAGIERAKEILRAEASFFDADAYASAVATIEAALRVVSATHFPVHLDFTAYRTPLGLTAMAEIERMSGPEVDPFHAYVNDDLIPRLRAAGCSVVGLSVCFPGQLQPAYAFALAIKRAMPDVHVTCGGPCITQMLIRLSGKRLAHALGPFDSACVFEGERTLLGLVHALAGGQPLRELPNLVVRDRLLGARYLPGHGQEDPKTLPAPDFEGLPLDRYLTPRLILPYDPTRGCYWGKCTFCHYGLAEVGTATYRERHVDVVVDHLRQLSERHGTRWFYFSQDSVAPKTLLKLSQAIIDAGLDVRWATDLKPEKYLNRERAQTLRQAGAVACALGVESGSERVLELIDKGAPPTVVALVIDNLAEAGVAVEAMCFTEFPTESHREAVETLSFIDRRRTGIALYIVGEFGLTHGSLVAQEPSRFGIRETWELEGDQLGLGIFFAPERPWKTDDERADVDSRLSDLSRGWVLRTYPWAGAVSTAHTVLYYERFGPDVFKTLAERGVAERLLADARFEAELRFDPEQCARAAERDSTIWATLVGVERRVSRGAYEHHATRQPALAPRPCRVLFASGREPKRVRGRRPSAAPNAARS